MFRNLLLLSLMLSLTLSAFAKKNTLSYAENGTFKIVQFTDLHLTDEVAETVFGTLKNVLSIEKPDLVVLTGDVTCAESNTALIAKLGFVFEQAHIQWAMVLGNHDDEFGVSKADLVKQYQSLPYNLNGYAKGIDGETNFTLTVCNNKGQAENTLYFFDSHAYNPLKDRVKGSYAWMEYSQINWYREQSAGFTKKNKGIPVPALAFFHIPLPEYAAVWENDSANCVGVFNEDVCSPEMNTGLFTAMLECNDVMGMFTGHDHVNDYIGSYNGIALGYGRFSGSKSTYGNLTPGGRVIVLKEGERAYDTWIRTAEGEKLNACTYNHGKLATK